MPGVKLGLANLAVLMAIYTLGVRGALIISLSRIFLDGMTFGNAYRMMYSLAGGILSFIIMYMGKRWNWSVMSVSMAGGLCHNYWANCSGSGNFKNTRNDCVFTSTNFSWNCNGRSEWSVMWNDYEII